MSSANPTDSGRQFYKVYHSTIAAHAAKQMSKKASSDWNRIEPRIADLSREPRPAGVQALSDGSYRIRVRDWRIIYRVVDADRVVLVLAIRKRDEQTYRDIG